MLVYGVGRRSARATWFLTTAASVSTLMCPPSAHAFSAAHGAAFAPVLAAASQWEQRHSLGQKGRFEGAFARPALGAWGQLFGRSCAQRRAAWAGSPGL